MVVNTKDYYLLLMNPLRNQVTNQKLILQVTVVSKQSNLQWEMLT